MYWCQMADERLGDPPQGIQYNGQRQEWKTPKRTPWHCTASVCVAIVHC